MTGSNGRGDTATLGGVGTKPRRTVFSPLGAGGGGRGGPRRPPRRGVKKMGAWAGGGGLPDKNRFPAPQPAGALAHKAPALPDTYKPLPARRATRPPPSSTTPNTSRVCSES